MSQKPAAQRVRRAKRFGERISGDDAEQPRKYLSGPAVCRRYSISDMSLWRWLHDPALGFPQPDFLVRKRRFWNEDTLRAWELQRARRAS